MRDHRIAVGVSLEGKIHEHGFFLAQIVATNRRELLRPPDMIERYNVTRPESEGPVFPDDVEIDLLR